MSIQKYNIYSSSSTFSLVLSLLTPLLALAYLISVVYQQYNHTTIESKYLLNDECEKISSTCVSAFFCTVAFYGSKTQSANNLQNTYQIESNQNIDVSVCHGHNEYVDILSYSGIEPNPNNPYPSFHIDTFTEFPAASFPDQQGYGYIALNHSPARLIKVELSSMTRVASLDFLPGEDKISTAFSDTIYGYIMTDSTPVWIVKVQLSDMTRVDALSLHQVQDHVIDSIIESSKEFGYLCTDSTPASIIKIHLSTLQINDTIILSSINNPCISLSYDENQYIYMTTSNQIIKYSIANMSKISTLNLARNNGNPIYGFVDGPHNIGYILVTEHGIITYPLSTMNAASYRKMQFASMYIDPLILQSGFVDSQGNIYIIQSAPISTIIQISISTEAVAPINFRTDIYQLQSCFPWNDYMYCTTLDTPATYFSFRLAPPLPTGTKTLIIDATIFGGPQMYDDKYGYIMQDTYTLIKYDLATMTLMSTFTLTQGSFPITHCYFHTHGYAYIVAAPDDKYIPTIKLFKIDLSTMTLTNTITFVGPFNYVYATFTDGEYGYYHFHNSRTQSTLIKLSLSNYTIVGSASLNVTCTTIFINDGQGYSWAIANPSWNRPPIFKKIRLSDMIVVESLSPILPIKQFYGSFKMIQDDTYAYILTTSTPAYLLQFYLSNMTYINITDVGYAGSMTYDSTGKHIIFGNFGGTCSFTKMKVPEMIMLNSTSLVFGAEYPEFIYFDNNLHRLHVGAIFSGARFILASIPIDSFDRINDRDYRLGKTLKFNMVEDNYGSMLVDTNSRYAYVLTSTSIVKIDTHDMSYISSVTIEYHSRSSMPGFSDNNDYGYFCYNTKQGGSLIKFRKVDMSIIRHTTFFSTINSCFYDGYQYLYIFVAYDSIMKLDMTLDILNTDTAPAIRSAQAIYGSSTSSVLDIKSSVYYVATAQYIESYKTSDFSLSDSTILPISLTPRLLFAWNKYLVVTDSINIYKVNGTDLSILYQHSFNDKNNEDIKIIHGFTDDEYGYFILSNRTLMKMNMNEKMSYVDSLALHYDIDSIYYDHKQYVYMVSIQHIIKIYLPVLYQQSLSIRPSSTSIASTSSGYSESLVIGHDAKLSAYSIQPNIQIDINKVENKTYTIQSVNEGPMPCISSVSDYGYCSRLSLASSRLVTTESRPYTWYVLIGIIGGNTALILISFSIIVSSYNHLTSHVSDTSTPSTSLPGSVSVSSSRSSSFSSDRANHDSLAIAEAATSKLITALSLAETAKREAAEAKLAAQAAQTAAQIVMIQCGVQQPIYHQPTNAGVGDNDDLVSDKLSIYHSDHHHPDEPNSIVIDRPSTSPGPVNVHLAALQIDDASTNNTQV